ncbi:hypothetical protein HEP84_57285 [Streptomyces sp. RLB1-33]
MRPLAEDLAPLPAASTVVATARVRAGHNGRTTTLPLLSSDGPFTSRGSVRVAAWRVSTSSAP